MTTYSGQCLCHRTRVTFSKPPISQGICYCEHCQKAGGALGSPFLVLHRKNLECLSSHLSSYETQARRGSTVVRYFCSACGSPLFSEISDVPEIITLKATVLDDRELFKPEYVVWTKSVAPSTAFPEGLPRFRENAPLSLLLKIPEA